MPDNEPAIFNQGVFQAPSLGAMPQLNQGMGSDVIAAALKQSAAAAQRSSDALLQALKAMRDSERMNKDAIPALNANTVRIDSRSALRVAAPELEAILQSVANKLSAPAQTSPVNKEEGLEAAIRDLSRQMKMISPGQTSAPLSVKELQAQATAVSTQALIRAGRTPGLNQGFVSPIFGQPTFPGGFNIAGQSMPGLLTNITPMENRQINPGYIGPSPMAPYYRPVTRPNYEALQAAGLYPGMGGVTGMGVSMPGAEVGRLQTPMYNLPSHPQASASTFLSTVRGLASGFAGGVWSTAKGAVNYGYQGIFGAPEFNRVDATDPAARGLYGGMYGTTMSPSGMQAYLQGYTTLGRELANTSQAPRSMSPLDYMRENSRASADYTHNFLAAVKETALSPKQVFGTIGGVLGGALGGGLPGMLIGGLVGGVAGDVLGSVAEPVFRPFRERMIARRQGAMRLRGAVGDLYLGTQGKGLDQSGRLSIATAYQMSDRLNDIAISNMQMFSFNELGQMMQSGVAKGMFDTTRSPMEIMNKLPGLAQNVDIAMRMQNLRTIDEAVGALTTFQDRGGSDATGKAAYRHFLALGVSQRMAGLSSEQARLVEGESALNFMEAGMSGNLGAEIGITKFDAYRRARRSGGLRNYDIMRFGGDANFIRQSRAGALAGLQGPAGDILALADTGMLMDMTSGGMGLGEAYSAAAANLNAGDPVKNILNMKYNRNEAISNNIQKMRDMMGPAAEMRQKINTAVLMSKQLGFDPNNQGMFMESLMATVPGMNEAEARELWAMHKDPAILRNMNNQYFNEKAVQALEIDRNENSWYNKVNRGVKAFGEGAYNYGTSIVSNAVEFGMWGGAIGGVVGAQVGAVVGATYGAVRPIVDVMSSSAESTAIRSDRFWRTLGINIGYTSKEGARSMDRVLGITLLGDDKRVEYLEDMGLRRTQTGRAGEYLSNISRQFHIGQEINQGGLGLLYGTGRAISAMVNMAGGTLTQEVERFGVYGGTPEEARDKIIRNTRKLAGVMTGVNLSKLQKRLLDPDSLKEKDVDNAYEVAGRKLGMSKDELLQASELLQTVVAANGGILDTKVMADFIEELPEGVREKVKSNQQAFMKFVSETAEDRGFVSSLAQARMATDNAMQAIGLTSESKKALLGQTMNRISDRMDFVDNSSSILDRIRIDEDKYKEFFTRGFVETISGLGEEGMQSAKDLMSSVVELTGKGFSYEDRKYLNAKKTKAKDELIEIIAKFKNISKKEAKTIVEAIINDATTSGKKLNDEERDLFSLGMPLEIGMGEIERLDGSVKSEAAGQAVMKAFISDDQMKEDLKRAGIDISNEQVLSMVNQMETTMKNEPGSSAESVLRHILYKNKNPLLHFRAKESRTILKYLRDRGIFNTDSRSRDRISAENGSANLKKPSELGAMGPEDTAARASAHRSGTGELGNVGVPQAPAARSFKASDYVITEEGVAKVNTQKLDGDIRSKKVPLIRSGSLNLEAKEYAKALNQARAAQRESSLQKGDSSGQPVNKDKNTVNLERVTASLDNVVYKLNSTHKSLETIMHTVIGNIA